MVCNNITNRDVESHTRNMVVSVVNHDSESPKRSALKSESQNLGERCGTDDMISSTGLYGTAECNNKGM